MYNILQEQLPFLHNLITQSENTSNYLKFIDLMRFVVK